MKVLQKLFKTIFKNTIIFFASIFVAIILLYAAKNPNFLQASVLGIQDIRIIKENKRDVAYKNTDGLLDIFLSQSLLEKYDSFLNISILYNYDEVEINIQDILSQKQYEIISQQSGQITFLFDSIKEAIHSESFLTIPFIGSIKDVLVSEANVGDSQYGLSVGNLTPQTEH